VRVTFSTADDQTAPWTNVRTLAWAELCELLTRHEVGPKEGPCVVPATFRSGRRKMAEAERIEIVMLDSDAGATLEQIATAIRAHGWPAIISSTHSHLTIRTTAKRGNWDKFRLAHGDEPGTAEAFL
jgi:putative DNA primase/helicase